MDVTGDLVFAGGSRRPLVDIVLFHVAGLVLAVDGHGVKGSLRVVEVDDAARLHGQLVWRKLEVVLADERGAIRNSVHVDVAWRSVVLIAGGGWPGVTRSVLRVTSARCGEGEGGSDQEDSGTLGQ